jgi:hypothetical protein
MLRRLPILGLCIELVSACSGNGTASASTGDSLAVGGASTAAGSTVAPTGGASNTASSATSTGGAAPTGGAATGGTSSSLGPPPKIVAFNVLGSPPTGGGLLLIVGTNLHADTQVLFGSALATPGSYAAGSPDQLTAVVPPSPLLPARLGPAIFTMGRLRSFLVFHPRVAKDSTSRLQEQTSVPTRSVLVLAYK